MPRQATNFVAMVEGATKVYFEKVLREDSSSQEEDVTKCGASDNPRIMQNWSQNNQLYPSYLTFNK